MHIYNVQFCRYMYATEVYIKAYMYNLVRLCLCLQNFYMGFFLPYDILTSLFMVIYHAIDCGHHTMSITTAYSLLCMQFNLSM